MGGRTYPQQRLNDAWTLVMGGQFHDIAAGTATPRAYEFARNDDVIALNQFADVLTERTEAVASALEHADAGRSGGRLQPAQHRPRRRRRSRRAFPGGRPKAVRVIGPDGKRSPAQVEDGKVLFLARAPSVGYAVYDVHAARAPQPLRI